VWRIERWEQREPILDQFGRVRDEKLSSIGDDRADSGEVFIVAVGDFQHREAPDSPAVVALVDGSLEQVIVHCSGAQSHNDKTGWCSFVAERDLLEHCSRVPTIDMRDASQIVDRSEPSRSGSPDTAALLGSLDCVARFGLDAGSFVQDCLHGVGIDSSIRASINTRNSPVITKTAEQRLGHAKQLRCFGDHERRHVCPGQLIVRFDVHQRFRSSSAIRFRFGLRATRTSASSVTKIDGSPERPPAERVDESSRGL
jgi:hypothetical protein